MILRNRITRVSKKYTVLYLTLNGLFGYSKRTVKETEDLYT